MREGHSGWNLAAQKITQQFPTLLNVVQQQFLWWNKGLDTMVVLTVSLTKNSSWPGICSAKSSIKIGIENKVDFSCCWGQNPVKFAVSHSCNKLKLIDQTFHPRIFFSFAQNYFTIRKSFQYFLPEKISGRVHKPRHQNFGRVVLHLAGRHFEKHPPSDLWNTKFALPSQKPWIQDGAKLWWLMLYQFFQYLHKLSS